MSLEHALLDRLEKRNAQIEMLQQTIQAMSHTADAEREHTRQQLGPLIEENKKLAAQIESDENVSQSNREHAQYQIASLTAEVARLRAEVPLESTREGLKNAVAKLQEVTTERDRLVIKFANLGSYAMTIGRKEGEPLEMFMERQALRLAAYETKIELRPIENRIGHFAVICTKCDELEKATAKIKPLDALYKTLKGYQDSDSIIGHGTIIEVAIDKATEALSKLTA